MAKTNGVSQSFALMGAASASLPASIPLRADQLSVPSAELLAAVPSLFFGLFIGILITPLISLYMNSNTQVKEALAVQALGVLGIGFLPSKTLFIIASFVIGLGFGQLEVLITSITRVDHEDVGRALTRIGAYLAFCAFLTPILYIVIGPRFVYLSIALISLILFLIFNATAVQSSKQTTKILSHKSSKVYLLLLASALYVGSETILAGWSSVFLKEMTQVSASKAALGTSLFWLCLTLGRLVGSATTGKLFSIKFASILWPSSFTLSLLTLAFAGGAHNGVFFVTLLLLAIFCAGPCYGFIIGLAVSFFDSSIAVKSASLYVLIGAIGGVLVPLAVQITSHQEIQKTITGAALAALISTICLSMSFPKMVTTHPLS